MTNVQDGLNAKRFGAGFAISVVSYVLALCLVGYVVRHSLLGQGWLSLLALLPAAGVVAMIWVSGVFVSRMQVGYERYVVERALLGATGCTLALTAVSGAFEMFTAMPHLPAYLIFPAFCFFFGVCAAVVRARSGGLPSHE